MPRVSRDVPIDFHEWKDIISNTPVVVIHIWAYKNAKCVGFISSVPVLENFFIQKWYMDHFWRWFLNTVIYGTFSKWFTFNDRQIVDGGVDGVAFSTVGGGRFCPVFRPPCSNYPR